MKKTLVTKAPVPDLDPKPERTAIIPRVQSVVEKARSLLSITDSATYEAAAEFLKTIKAMMAEIDATHDPVIQHWHKKHKASLAEKKEDVTPLEQAEMLLKSSIGKYLREEQLKAERDAARRKKEFEDKIRAQAEEENMARAEELMAFGDLEGAAAAVDAEIVVPDIPVEVMSTVSKVSGISLRQTYRAEVRDLDALLKGVVGGAVPREAIEVNQTFLNAQARAVKKTGALFGYPGVVVVAEDGVSAGKE